MNHLLVFPHELDANAEFDVVGERAAHLLHVLKVQPGVELRAARLNQETGSALVLEVGQGRVRLRYKPGAPLAAPPTKLLLLAIPRPKVISRCIQHAAALGFSRILLFRSYRVEKAHLDSARLEHARLQADAFIGLEQARLVHMPEIEVFTRFKPFVEDQLSERVGALPAYVAHPTAARSTLDLASQRSPVARPYCLAIGPEGGLIDYEVQQLEAQGFQALSFGPAPLRVESALSYMTGQLDWLHAPHPV